MDKCVFHEDFKKSVENSAKDLKKVGEDTIVNTNKIKSMERTIEELKKEFNEFKKETNNKFDRDRREIISFIKWFVVLGFTVFAFLFGVIQWILDKQ